MVSIQQFLIGFHRSAHVYDFFPFVIFFECLTIFWILHFVFQSHKRQSFCQQFAPYIEINAQWGRKYQEEWIIKNQAWIDEFERLQKNNPHVPVIHPHSPKIDAFLKRIHQWYYQYQLYFNLGVGVFYIFFMYGISILIST